MPTLVHPETGTPLDLDTRSRVHWFIGRALECDIVFEDPGISRFHATVFRCHNEYYLIDHSLNGTHLCRPGQEPQTATRLPSLSPDNPTQDNTNTQPRTRKPQHDTEELPAVQDENNPSWHEISDLNKSHAAFLVEQSRTRLPRMIGYNTHEFHAPEDMRPLLESIYSSDGVATLASMGRKLLPDSRIVIVGTAQHDVTFTQ